MKKKLLLFFLAVSMPFLLNAQRFYFKPEVRYHSQLTTQVSPEYFTLTVYFPFGQNLYISPDIKKFSLANGFSYGGIFGYNLSGPLSLEFGIDYFRNEESFKSVYVIYASSSSEWLINSVNATPALSLHREMQRSSFTARFGGILGFTAVDKTIKVNESEMTYELRGNMSVGYMLGFGYSYKLNQFLSLEAGAGIENIFYTPSRGTLTENEFSTLDPDNYPTYIKKIRFVRKLDYQEGGYSRDTNMHFLNYNEPSVRLSETLRLNSLFFEIGLKYKFNAHEEN